MTRKQNRKLYEAWLNEQNLCFVEIHSRKEAMPDLIEHIHALDYVVLGADSEKQLISLAKPTARNTAAMQAIQHVFGSPYQAVFATMIDGKWTLTSVKQPALQAGSDQGDEGGVEGELTASKP